MRTELSLELSYSRSTKLHLLKSRQGCVIAEESTLQLSSRRRAELLSVFPHSSSARHEKFQNLRLASSTPSPRFAHKALYRVQVGERQPLVRRFLLMIDHSQNSGMMLGSEMCLLRRST